MPKLNNWMEDYYGYALEFGDVGDYLDLSPSSLLPDPDNFTMQVNNRIISFRGDETAVVEDGEVVVGGRNMLQNSNYSDGSLNRWVRSTPAPATAEVVTDITAPYGDNAAKLTMPNKAHVWLYQSFASSILDGGTYALSGYVKLEPGTTGRAGIIIRIYYTDGTNETFVCDADMELFDVWQKLDVVGLADPTKEILRIQSLAPWANNITGVMYGTGYKLEKGNLATPYTPAPEDITSLTRIDRTLPYFPADGVLKTLRFYDRGLSDAEMMQNWNAGQGEDYVKDGLVFDGDFIGHGAILPDKTGHQNNATIHGPTWITIGRVPEKVIILNPKMRRVADLDPAKVIDPVTVEDLNTGEHTLSLGYPVDDSRDSGGRGGGGGGQNIRRLTGGGGGVEAWAGCEMDRTAIMTINGGEGQEQGQGQVVVCLDAEREAAEIEAEFNDQASWATGIFDDNCIAVDGKLRLGHYYPIQPLYDGGNEYSALTGGWSQGGYTRGNATVTKGSTTITLAATQSGNQTASVLTNNKIDITNYSKVILYASFSGSGSDIWSAFTLVSTRATTGTEPAWVKRIDANHIGGSHVIEMNVEGLTGSYYVDITIDATSSATQTIIISKVEMVRSTPAYLPFASWLSPAIPLQDITEAASSLLQAIAAIPSGTSIALYAGLSESAVTLPATWAAQISGYPLSVISPGNNYSSKFARIKLELAATDTTITPEVSFLSLSVTQDRAYYSTGAITLPPLDIAAARTIASATADLKATVISDPQSGQSVTLQMSVDGGVTWDDNYMLPYGTSVDDLPTQFILTRIKLETADPGTTPFVEQLLEEILVAAEVAHLTSGNILIIADPDGDLVPFVIYQDRTFAGTEETVKEVNCTHLYYELADGPASSYSLINQSPATAIAAALQGTRWTLGDIAPALANLTKDFDGILQNPLERLRQIEKEYQARLKFRVTMNGGSGGSGGGSGQGKTIGAFLVDLEEIEDTFSGKRFEFGRDLQGIDVQVDHSQIKTALIGTALGEEIDLATGDPLPLTFESVKWSKAAGDPADKPVGQNWVGNEESRELYGIFDPATGQMTHRFGIYESEAESPKTLLDATWLIGTRYHFQPRVTIEGRVADLEKVKILDIKTGKLATLSHEKVRLGQITYVVARDKGLLAAVDVKISRILRHIKAPELTTITWGDPILVGSDYVQEIGRRADWKERRRRKLDRGRGGQTVTVAHETTSSAPYYASFVVRDGEMLNDVFGDILSLLPANGGQIVFAEGTYPYDGSLLIDRDNVTIKGQGEGTRFVLKEGTAGDAYGFHADGRDNITIADFSMDGRKANQEGDIFASGVNFWHCNNVLIENVSVKDMKKSGIILAGVIDGRVANCSSSENGESGILIRDRSTTGKGCELVAAENNRCWDNGTRGIAIHNSEEIEVLSNTLNDNNYNVYAENCESLTVTGNNTRWSTAHCMYFRDVHNSIISNNLCNETVFKGNIAVDGMAFYNCSKNTVSDNACGDNSGFGMRFTGSPGVRCSDNIISGNQCSGNSFDGIALWSADRCTITGNTCCDNDWNGLMLNTNPPTDAFTDNNVVQNNVCNNNNMYGIHISGDNNLVTNNDCQGNNWDGIVDWGTNTKLTAGNRT